MQLVVLVDVAVGVPVLVVVAAAGVNLHKADAALDEPPRHQAAPAESLGAGVVESVELLRFRRFARQIDGLGSARLHPERQLVAGDAGRQLRVVAAELRLTQLGQQVELVALLGGGDAVRRQQVQDRVAARRGTEFPDRSPA